MQTETPKLWDPYSAFRHIYARSINAKIFEGAWAFRVRMHFEGREASDMRNEATVFKKWEASVSVLYNEWPKKGELLKWVYF